MKTLTALLTIATLAAAATSIGATPSFAMTGSQAIKACSHSKTCQVLTNDGGGIIVVHNPSGTTIYCPPGGKGNCHRTN